MIDDELLKLFQELAEISLLWNEAGVVHSYIEAPWVPTPMKIVELIIDMISVGTNDVVYDLGCGDGRIAIEAAKRGARAVCIEINPRLIEVSRRLSRIAGVEDKIVFVNDDILNVDLSQATVIYMYLLTKVINKLKDKFFKELRSGTTIVSLDYEIDWLAPTDVIEVDGENYHRIFLYLV